MNQAQKRVVDRPLRLQDLPRNKENMFLVNVRSLKLFEFGKCVVSEACLCGSRPCKGARVLDPTVNRKKTMLCCSIRKEHVSADVSASCKMQQ